MELSLNLRKLLLEKDLTEAELARQTGIAQPVVHRIISGKNQNPKLATIKPIAEFFNITLSQLLGETILDMTSKPSSVIKSVLKSWSSIPLLPETKIKDWANNDWENFEKTVVTDAKTINKMFAIELNDNSMSPKFTKGTILIFDTGRIPRNKNYVIATVKGKNIFRQIIVEENNTYLISISSLTKNKVIQLTDKVEVLGVLIQAKKDFLIAE